MTAGVGGGVSSSQPAVLFVQSLGLWGHDSGPRQFWSACTAQILCGFDHLHDGVIRDLIAPYDDMGNPHKPEIILH